MSTRTTIFLCLALLTAGSVLASQAPARSSTGSGYEKLLTSHDATQFNYGEHRPVMPPPPQKCAAGYHQETGEHYSNAGGGYFVLVVGCIPNGFYSQPQAAILPLPAK